MGRYSDLDVCRRKGGPAVVLLEPARSVAVLCDDSATLTVALWRGGNFPAVVAVASEQFGDALRFDLKHGLI